jgi:MFS family permease
MNQKISGYGWSMVACGFLILLVTNGMTLTGITVFDNALLSEFGWQRGALKLRDLITFAGAGLVAPLFGYFADRGQIKNCLLLGCGFLAAGFITYSRINSLAGLYLAHAFFGLSLASAGIVSVVFLVSTQVPASRRGLALGLALVGSSFGNSIFPQMNLGLLKTMDWRSAFLALSLVPAVLSVCVVATVRRSAHSRAAIHAGKAGLPLQDNPQTSSSSAFAENDRGLGFVLQQRSFWMIGSIAMLTFFAILGVSTHLFLRLTGAGYSPQFAGNTLGLLFLTGLFGKVLSGFLADRFGDRRVMALSMLLMILGAAGLSQFVGSNVRSWVVAFGLGWGALYTLIQVSVVSTFGTTGAGRVLGSIAFLEALGGGLGPWVIGLTFDKTGSYNLPFSLVAGLLLVAFVLNFFRSGTIGFQDLKVGKVTGSQV